MTRWIEKQRNVLDYTISSLLRRRGKNLSLLTVYTLVVFVLASAVLFTQAMKREASLILSGAPEIVVQRLLQGRYDPIPMSYLEKIRKIRGVTSVGVRLWGYVYDSTIGANYTLMVPPTGVPGRDRIIIGDGISKSRMIHPGDTMAFRTYEGRVRTFTVADVISPQSALVSADLVLVSESDFRGIFGLPTDRATDLVISVRNPKEMITIAAKISEMFPDARPIIRDEMARTYDSVFDWRGGLLIALFSMVLFAFIILAWEKASGLSAEERREIGILKAIGWEISDVITVKAYEGLLVSFFSFGLGTALAYVHVFLSSAFIFAPVLKGWSVLYPDFRLVPFIDPYQIAIMFFLTVLPYTVATIVPSWRAAIVDPDSVMRT